MTNSHLTTPNRKWFSLSERPTDRFRAAMPSAIQFVRGQITAIEFEQRLLALGFYNIRFTPPSAVIDGVRYNLLEASTDV